MFVQCISYAEFCVPSSKKAGGSRTGVKVLYSSRPNPLPGEGVSLAFERSLLSVAGPGILREASAPTSLGRTALSRNVSRQSHSKSPCLEWLVTATDGMSDSDYVNSSPIFPCLREPCRVSVASELRMQLRKARINRPEHFGYC